MYVNISITPAGLALQGDLLPITIHLWSLVHGLAALWVSGSLRLAPPEGGGIEGFTEIVLRNAARDLALAARAAAPCRRDVPQKVRGSDVQRH